MSAWADPCMSGDFVHATLSPPKVDIGPPSGILCPLTFATFLQRCLLYVSVFAFSSQHSVRFVYLENAVQDGFRSSLHVKTMGRQADEAGHDAAVPDEEGE